MKAEILASGDPFLLSGKIIDIGKGTRKEREHKAGLCLLRYGMQLLDLPASDICTNEHGKPFFKGENQPFFSISHAGEYAACAISHKEIGCDIEKIRRVPHTLERELGKIDKVGYHILSDDPMVYQTQKWTVYEAIGKCLGTGIPVDEEAIDDKWRCESWAIDSTYIISIAFRNQMKYKID